MRLQQIFYYTACTTARNSDLGSIAGNLDAGAVDILGLNASLALADVGLCPLFDADGLNLDESGGVSGLEAAELVHGGLLLVVETLQEILANDRIVTS